jgi:hypothetical protein
VTAAAGAGGASGAAATGGSGAGGTAGALGGGAGGMAGAAVGGGAGAPTTEKPGRLVVVIGGQDERHLVSFDGGNHYQDDVYLPPQGKDLALTGIAVGARTIVASGDSGIMTSRDGKKWDHVLVNGEPAPGLHSSKALYAGGRFVVVGGDKALTSPDGQTWTFAKQKDSFPHVGALAYGAGHYLVYGDDRRAISEDGLTWHDFVDGDPATDPKVFAGVAFGKDHFVAVGQDGRHAISTDGLVWTNAGTDAAMAAVKVSWVQFGGGTFVAGSSGTVFTSPDGVVWTKRANGPNGSIAWAGDHWVGAGWYASSYTSPDGEAFAGKQTGEGDNVFDPTKKAPFFTGIGAGEIDAL